MGDRSRGFTLVELLVAVAIAVVLGALLLRATTAVLHWTLLQAARDSEHMQIGELVDRLEAEEDSAWAIFTPPKDVTGAPNRDGHEVDFFNRDGENQAYFWAYTYDAAAKTLTRYTYGALGGAATADVTYTGITAFDAQTYPVTALQDPASKIYSPLYAGASLRPGAVTFFPGTDVAGGNQITYVRIQSPTLVRELQLSTQTAPSGFVVVLQYTPAPTPTPKIALESWPQFIELPMNGQALQTASLPARYDTAYLLNRLLGGGIAEAALSACATNQGRAFTGSTFSTPLANTAAPAGFLPAGVTGYTDAGGCITFRSSTFTNGMPNVALYEPGYTGLFGQIGSTCGLAVQIVRSYPAAQSGPSVQIFSHGGSQLIQTCAVDWQDQQSTPAHTSTSYEVSGCITTGTNTYQLVGLGAQCVGVGSSWSSTIPDCSPGGTGGIEYSPSGITVSGPALAADNNDGTFTLTRSGMGTIGATYAFIETMCRYPSGTRIVHGAKTYSFTD